MEYVENSVESVENAIFRLILEFFAETPPPRPAGPEPRKPRLFSAPANKTAGGENPVENLSKFSAPFPPHFPLPRPKSFAQKSSDGKKTIKRMQRSGEGRCGISRGVSGAGKPDRPIKRKCSVSSGARCGGSRGVRNSGRPASQFWQRRRRGGVRGVP